MTSNVSYLAELNHLKENAQRVYQFPRELSFEGLTVAKMFIGIEFKARLIKISWPPS